MDETKDVVYRILRLLKENAIKILMSIKEKEKIRWKELQDITKLPTATFNRALAALQEIHFIKKEDGFYTLTWTGKLVCDGLLMLGWRLGEEEEEEIEDAEKLLAKDIAMAIVVLLIISLKRRGKLNLDEFENELVKEMKISRKILEEYEKDGYLEIKDGVIFAKEKLKEIDITGIFH
ncbi:MAG: hypothetical protein J7K95_00380 [Thermoplasmata archaeon]|nr:hypothetical protein [Thermoplasmata archaeon]